jgi:hypothetical protein
MLPTTHCSLFLASAVCHATNAIYVAGVHILGFGEENWRDHLEKLEMKKQYQKRILKKYD